MVPPQRGKVQSPAGTQMPQEKKGRPPPRERTQYSRRETDNLDLIALHQAVARRKTIEEWRRGVTKETGQAEPTSQLGGDSTDNDNDDGPLPENLESLDSDYIREHIIFPRFQKMHAQLECGPFMMYKDAWLSYLRDITHVDVLGAIVRALELSPELEETHESIMRANHVIRRRADAYREMKMEERLKQEKDILPF